MLSVWQNEHEKTMENVSPTLEEESRRSRIDRHKLHVVETGFWAGCRVGGHFEIMVGDIYTFSSITCDKS